MDAVPYDPFRVPQQRIHFFKKFHLSDYPPKSTFDYSGIVFMAIYQDDTDKVVSNWPLDLKFIPKKYPPTSYVLLYYFDADAPPSLYTRETRESDKKLSKWVE